MEKLSKEECERRVKLSLDLQRDGEIPAYFGDGGEVAIVFRDHEHVFVCTTDGNWAVTEDGDCIEAEVQRVH